MFATLFIRHPCKISCGKNGLIADVKQEFPQICIDKNDQNYLRLLWFDNVNDPVLKIKIFRFTRFMYS